VFERTPIRQGGNMLEKIKKALALYGVMLPGAVKTILLDMGAEFDRMRAEVDELRSKLHGDGK
jgi:hypothetical protein